MSRLIETDDPGNRHPARGERREWHRLFPSACSVGTGACHRHDIGLGRTFISGFPHPVESFLPPDMSCLDPTLGPTL